MSGAQGSIYLLISYNSHPTSLTIPTPSSVILTMEERMTPRQTSSAEDDRLLCSPSLIQIHPEAVATELQEPAVSQAGVLAFGNPGHWTENCT
ncbi:Hypothetical predicted protein, partial [Marmota monax]